MLETQWYEEAENNGLMQGRGECAKRLKQLAKKDRRKLKSPTEHREQVRAQLGEALWKSGIVGLSIIGKPRGKKIPALPETIS